MIRSLSTISLGLLAFSLAAHAEYRAFLHHVKVTQPLGDAVEYGIMSSLDAKQFESFYGGNSGVVQVKAIRSWYCPNHTGYLREICADPQGKLFPRGPFPVGDIQN